MTATIGKYYATALQYLNDSAKSEYYVADASAQMSLSMLQANAKRLSDQLAMWNDRLINSSNAKEITNIGKIVETQSAKLDVYNRLISEKDGDNIPDEINYGGGNEGNNNNPSPLPPVSNNKNNTALLMGGALLLILLLKK